jgi:hypothetical protein
LFLFDIDLFFLYAALQAVPSLFNNSVLCAGFVNGNLGSCRGDSGGPLLWFNTDEDKMVQIGIHSGAASCASIDFPEIYGNLADEFTLKFVQAVMGRNFESTESFCQGSEKNIIPDKKIETKKVLNKGILTIFFLIVVITKHWFIGLIYFWFYESVELSI